LEIRELHWTANVCVFKCPKHGPSFAPTTLVLGVLDSLQRRFSACLYIILGDITQKYHLPLSPVFSQIDPILLQLRATYGENFFSLLNSWHSLVTGHVLEAPDDLGFSDLKRVILTSLQEMVPGWEVYGLLPLILPPPTGIQEISIVIELSGLAKAYGHPCIKTHVGMQTMREHACQVKSYKLEWGEVVRANFNYHYTKNFYKKHSRWPAHKCKYDCHPTLRHHSMEGTWPIGDEMRALTPRDWSGL
jgi:hypothetical protein